MTLQSAQADTLPLDGIGTYTTRPRAIATVNSICYAMFLAVLRI